MASTQLIALRCVKCGAPLPQPPPGAEYIKCEYCGYTQKVVDTQSYVEKLRGEIYSWIRSMIPTGVAYTENVDPIARHNIFVYNVKPKITADFTATKAKLYTSLSSPLVILPFYSPAIKKTDQPKKYFEDLVKFQSIRQLAVVDEDKAFLDDVEATYQTYAYILNATDLLLSKSELTLLIKNFEEAASSLEGKQGKDAEYKRMKGVVEAYKAINAFTNGDITAAKQFAQSALMYLENAIKDASKSPSSAIMIPFINQDISTIKTLLNLISAGAIIQEAGVYPTELLPYLSRYFSVTENIRIQKKANYNVYEELSSYLLRIVEAKYRGGSLEVIPGNGNILVPFYLVSITYTFTTGSLFWKKGKEYEDKMLVSATYPLASQAVTDIFRISSGFLDRLRGKEERLSTGYFDNIQIMNTSVPSSVKVIPPLLTKSESENVAESYLSPVNARLGGKIKFGSAQAVKLIFAFAEIRNNEVYIQSLGEYQVKLQPHINTLLSIAF